jgi:hypothetical protein
MSAIHCPNCGSVSPAGAIFCDNCGYDLRNVDKSPPSSPPAAAPSPAGVIVCQSCGYENLPDSAFCENCGSGLDLPEQQAVPAEYKTPDSQIETPSAPIPITSSRRLVIQNTNTSLPLIDKPVITLGREDPVSGIFPEIDLSPYGAQESGVGRQHAKIFVQGGETFIEDLNSVNGTLVNKQKLAPNEPVKINNGDEIRLGLLVIHYYID